MSFTVDLIVPALPDGDKKAWDLINVMREKYYNDQGEKAEVFLRLHAALTERYPCLCSYADDDPEMDNSPWADGPMLNNFCSEMGMLAIVFSRVDEVLPFILEKCSELGITVADGQSGKIHRPGDSGQTDTKPWWRFW